MLPALGSAILILIRRKDKETMQIDNNPARKAQIVYFSHGGGPLPLLGDASHEAMVDFMTELPGRLRKPDAIVVISAHWEESICTRLS